MMNKTLIALTAAAPGGCRRSGRRLGPLRRPGDRRPGRRRHRRGYRQQQQPPL
ncbi:MAG: hypothetical protein WDN06_00985 [Asticcacaulis sp.]